MTHPKPRDAVAFLVAVLSCLGTQAAAQSPAAGQTAGSTSPSAPQIKGPAAPVAPAVISRDEARRATIRATRLAEPLRLDGNLDESVYRTVPAISDFIQQVPREGLEASEKTETWVMFDGNNMYVAARCWDTAPPEQWVANEMRRDTSQLRQNDTFGVMFDTFYDRRNGYTFYANPLGGFSDFTITDEGNANPDWNPVWAVRTGRFEGGWTIEMAIPFKSLRYKSGVEQVWGVQFRRAIRRKNEWVYLTPVPASVGGAQGIFRTSVAATLVGLELPSASKNIEIKPYAISRLATDRLQTPPISNSLDPDFGVDAKVGVTANLTADLTYNTDFAQVEVDEQQVNLTRFSLLFPERREFFLEGRGIFDFARGPTTGGGAGANTSVVPTVFYTRRIGLNRNRVIPIDLGGRLTGKIGKFGLGAMNIQTGEESVSGTPATNFTVVRVKRDILRRSSIGALFTNRSKSTVAAGSNQTAGVDASFSFFQNITFGGYLAQTSTPTLKGDDRSYQARFDYGADRYGAKAEYLVVGDNFNPEVGFVRRDDFKRTFALARFSPRPKSVKGVRKVTWEASLEYFLNGAGNTESQLHTGRLNVEFETSDQFTVDATRDEELLVQPFKVSGVTVQVGSYTFSDVLFTYLFGQQRRASGSLSLNVGHFYDGTIRTLGFTGARVSLMKQLSFEPAMSVSHVELPGGDFTTKLYRGRSDYAFSPRMFASALLQYGSSDNAFSSSLRFRWEYNPGSEIFVVYTDERDTRASGVGALKNRALVVKVNRLMRF